MNPECSIDEIEIINTKLIINYDIYVFQKEVGDGLRYTCVQRKEHCKGSVTTNLSKTNILKYQIHSHKPDSAKVEVCCIVVP